MLRITSAYTLIPVRLHPICPTQQTHGKVENVDYSMIQKSDTVGTVMNVFSG